MALPTTRGSEETFTLAMAWTRQRDAALGVGVRDLQVDRDGQEAHPVDPLEERDAHGPAAEDDPVAHLAPVGELALAAGEDDDLVRRADDDDRSGEDREDAERHGAGDDPGSDTGERVEHELPPARDGGGLVLPGSGLDLGDPFPEADDDDAFADLDGDSSRARRDLDVLVADVEADLPEAVGKERQDDLALRAEEGLRRGGARRRAAPEGAEEGRHARPDDEAENDRDRDVDAGGSTPRRESAVPDIPNAPRA